jgi:hypothetical protein
MSLLAAVAPLQPKYWPGRWPLRFRRRPSRTGGLWTSHGILLERLAVHTCDIDEGAIRHQLRGNHRLPTALNAKCPQAWAVCHTFERAQGVEALQCELPHRASQRAEGREIHHVAQFESAEVWASGEGVHGRKALCAIDGDVFEAYTLDERINGGKPIEVEECEPPEGGAAAKSKLSVW